jgi:hypothetical protein
LATGWTLVPQFIIFPFVLFIFFSSVYTTISKPYSMEQQSPSGRVPSLAITGAAKLLGI